MVRLRQRTGRQVERQNCRSAKAGQDDDRRYRRPEQEPQVALFWYDHRVAQHQQGDKHDAQNGQNHREVDPGPNVGDDHDAAIDETQRRKRNPSRSLRGFFLTDFFGVLPFPQEIEHQPRDQRQRQIYHQGQQARHWRARKIGDGVETIVVHPDQRHLQQRRAQEKKQRHEEELS